MIIITMMTAMERMLHPAAVTVTADARDRGDHADFGEQPDRRVQQGLPGRLDRVEALPGLLELPGRPEIQDRQDYAEIPDRQEAQELPETRELRA